MKRKVLFVFLSLLLLAIFQGYAQIFTDYTKIEYLNSEDGLSQSEVTSIIKDRKGFIWIGTRGGLNRYDGSTIKVFQSEVNNKNSLLNNSIETLFEDSKGHIWIGTKSNGLSKYDPKQNLFQHFASENNEPIIIEDKRVIAIEESISNEIWIGTWQSGLYIYKPTNNSFKKIGGNEKINDIIRAKDGTMWLATANDIYVHKPNGEIIKQIKFKNKSTEITSIIQSIDEHLFYLGTWTEGLLVYDSNTGKFNQYKGDDNIKLKNAYNLFQDSNQNILIGTWGNGLNYFNTETKKLINYNLASGLSKGGQELYKDVLYVFEDELGILWLGTNGGGVCKVNKRVSQFEDTSQSNLPNEPVWTIAKDDNDNLLVGIKGDNHLYFSKNEREFSKIDVSAALPQLNNSRKDGIRVIYNDLDNNLWIANNSSLFNVDFINKEPHIHPLKIKSEKDAESEYLPKISALYQTKNKFFWIGTQQQGLKKSLSPGNPNNQVFKNYLEYERISSFLEDSQGRFWIGTYKGLKLYDFETDSFKTFYKKQGDSNSLSSDIIITLFEDSEGIVWIGTPNGLNRLMEKGSTELIFKSYDIADGLPNNYIHAILEDNQNNIWISTNKGLSKFNRQDNSFYNYDVNSGLLSNTFMEGSSFSSSDGKLYFGSIYGINKFDPKVIENSYVPPVVLTSLKVSGQEVVAGIENDQEITLQKAIEYNTEIILPPNKNTLTLEYTALDFLSNFGYSYNYKLEGLDKEWNTTATKKSITYTNLDSGDYVFKVKAKNDDANDDSKMATIKVKVLPVFWKTWPAFLMYVLVFIGLLYLYKLVITRQNNLKNKLELSKIKRKKEEELIKTKTRFFTNVAHEFRTPLSLISGPVELMMDDSLDENQRKGHLSTVYYHTQRLLNLVNQLLDFRKVESGKMKLRVAEGDFKKFANEIYLSFTELAESKNIKFIFNVDASSIPLTYDRQRMEIVLCNLLSNAFKYSSTNGKIMLSIENISDYSNDKFPLGYCKVSVKDNGAGISKEDIKLIFNRFYQISNANSSNLIGTGIGLSLVKNIVELHKGLVEVESEEDIGSEFIIKLPLGNDHFSAEDFITDYKKAEDPIHYNITQFKTSQSHKNKIVDLELPYLLVVEDNPDIRNFIRVVFQGKFNIIEAENGKAGLEKATKDLPDIIITDLAMPEMDGLMLCKNLREIKETMHIPIIMLTARTKTVFQEQGYSFGADIYVTKPFNASLLKAQVQGLLNNRNKLKDYFSKKITLQPTDIEITTQDEEFINNAIKTVEDNLLNENLNREFLADKMATSPSTLYRKIKALTDQDTTAFVRSIRIKRAAQMILNKQDNIGSIGYAVGFNDLKYFRKCFKDQFGVPPSKFTKKYKNINVVE